MGLINTVLTWLKKGEKIQGTDPTTPNDPNGVLNRPLNELLQNDVDLDTRLSAVEGGLSIAHTDTTGKQGNGEIHLSSIEKAGYDGLNGRVTSLENSGGGGGGGPSFLNQQVFTSNASFQIPSNVTKIKVTAVGGGGGGSEDGVSQMDAGGGGGGGAIAIFSVIPGETANIFVGAGGNGGASPTNGGHSTVGFSTSNGYISALGGFSSSGGNAGVGGQSNALNAQPNSSLLVPGQDGGNSSDGWGGTGGDSMIGSGGAQRDGSGVLGGGGANNNPGGNGVVIIEYNEPATVTVQGGGFNQLIMSTSASYTLPTGIPIRFIGIGGGGAAGGGAAGGGGGGSFNVTLTLTNGLVNAVIGASNGSTTLTADSTSYTAGGGTSGDGVYAGGIGGSAGPGGYSGGNGGNSHPSYSGQGGGGGGAAGGYGGGGTGLNSGDGAGAGSGGHGGSIYGGPGTKSVTYGGGGRASYGSGAGGGRGYGHQGVIIADW